MADKITFEKAVKRLEEIVKKLESGEAILDESVKLFEEGVYLSDHCNKLLETAEQKVTQLTKNQKGEVEEEPFNTDISAV